MAIFLRNLFAPKEDPCDCREQGIMYIGGNINDCIKCTDTMTTLDSHLFLKEAAVALIGWLAVTLEGKYIIINHKYGRNKIKLLI